jgi:hypothetical protein
MSKYETYALIFAVPIIIVLTVAYPHAVKYINRTPLERCESSTKVSHMGVGAAEDYCRAKLGMEPREKPVINQKKEVTISPESRAILDALYKEQKEVTISPENRAILDALREKQKEEKP